MEAINSHRPPTPQPSLEKMILDMEHAMGRESPGLQHLTKSLEALSGDSSRDERGRVLDTMLNALDEAFPVAELERLEAELKETHEAVEPTEGKAYAAVAEVFTQVSQATKSPEDRVDALETAATLFDLAGAATGSGEADFLRESLSGIFGILAPAAEYQAFVQRIAVLEKQLSTETDPVKREKLNREVRDLRRQLAGATATALAQAQGSALKVTQSIATHVASVLPAAKGIAMPIGQVAEVAAGNVQLFETGVALRKTVQALRSIRAESAALGEAIANLEDGSLAELLQLRRDYLEGRKLPFELAKLVKYSLKFAGNGTSIAASITGSSVAGPVAGAILTTAAAGGLALYVYAERANLEADVRTLPLKEQRWEILRMMRHAKTSVQGQLRKYEQRTTRAAQRQLQKRLAPTLKRLRQLEADRAELIAFEAVAVPTKRQARRMNEIMTRLKTFEAAKQAHAEAVAKAINHDTFLLNRVITSAGDAKGSVAQLQKHLDRVEGRIAAIQADAEEKTRGIKSGKGRQEMVRLRATLERVLDRINSRQLMREILSDRPEQFDADPVGTTWAYLWE